jgi:hypothetical protein
MISVQQYRKLMKEYDRSGKKGASAMKAGLDRRTARKYIEGAPGPEEPQARRNWRTHVDAFATQWDEVKRRLEAEPKLMAKTLWEELMREHGGKFSPGQKRSFERRVREWKERHGQEPVLYFSQEHRPGERIQIDWVDGRRLAVQIAGQQEEFAHKLVHVVLPYSNWEWARVVMSESYLSLKLGVQSAVWELGAVPLICQSDNSSTATHVLGRGSAKREYNARYLGLLAHYGMKGGLIGISKPHQNGDVESAHNHLISALEQALLLRSSRWFASLQAYEDFVMEVVRARNLPRQRALEQELVRMRPLPDQRLCDYEEQEVTVNRESMVRVGKQAYSVPSRWAGSRLRARISESRIAFYRAEMLVVEVERQSGDSGVYVNWRHVIGQLVRKPGAFARWRHRAAMFPSVQWRMFYDALCERYSQGRAEREYLGVLQLACDNGLEKVQSILQRLGWGEAGLDAVRRELDVAVKVVVVDFKADLGPYDAMIGASWHCEAEQTQEVGHG